MLIWLFTFQNDYKQALIQAKALDKRNNEDGGRILNLANDALFEKQYGAAIEAYDYILSKTNTKYVQEAKSNKLKAQKLKVTQTNSYTQEDLIQLKDNYSSYINLYGKKFESIDAMRELAHLEAYYIHDIKEAIALLNDILAIPQVPNKIRNEVKLDLGDYFVLDGDVWEATLLYAQVDKSERIVRWAKKPVLEMQNYLITKANLNGHKHN
ncbi:MAG: hypothetical protein LRY27_03665 [Chitinophagales bacterium]|nr:hypothetical protein [Chitinophagales bacterium]